MIITTLFRDPCSSMWQVGPARIGQAWASRRGAVAPPTGTSIPGELDKKHWPCSCWRISGWVRTQTGFAVEKEVRGAMEYTHRVLHVVFGPLEMGIPIRRRRALMAGLNRRTMVWTGPEDPAAIQEEFESLCKRTRELSGYVFFGCAGGGAPVGQGASSE